MTDMPEFARSPLALLVNEQEWAARSLESILGPGGYAVLKAYKGSQGMDLIRKVRPDVLIVSTRLPDMTGVEFCRRASRVSNMQDSTPVLMLSSSTPSRQERIDALSAGVWDVLHPPHDKDELLLKLQIFVRAKQDADEAREESLLDPDTGFYNVQGLLKRVGELVADAQRYGRPLACVVFGPDPEKEEEEPRAGGDEEKPARREVPPVPEGLSQAISSTVRLSDCIGRVGSDEFVVVAPGTDPGGARRLAERLLDALKEVSSSDAAEAEGAESMLAQIRAGYYAVPDFEDEPAVPLDIVTRATVALRQAQERRAKSQIQPYEGNGDAGGD